MSALDELAAFVEGVGPLTNEIPVAPHCFEARWEGINIVYCGGAPVWHWLRPVRDSGGTLWLDCGFLCAQHADRRHRDWLTMWPHAVAHEVGPACVFVPGQARYDDLRRYDPAGRCCVLPDESEGDGCRT